MASFELLVNGQNHTVEADRQMPLLWVLRDLLGLTGTKFSCGAGLCGSCTVLMDDEPVRSCMTPVENAAGKNILTIEGFRRTAHTRCKRLGSRSGSRSAATASPARS